MSNSHSEDLDQILSIVKDLQDEIAKLSDDKKALKEENESLRDRVKQLEKEAKVRESRINNITRSLDAIEEDLANIRTGSSNNLSPLENAVLNYPENPQKSTYIERASHERAAKIAFKFHDWSEAVKNGGQRINVRESKIKILYESEYDEKLQSIQIRRAFEAAADLSNGKLKYRQQSGNELYLPADEVLVISDKQLQKLDNQ